MHMHYLWMLRCDLSQKLEQQYFYCKWSAKMCNLIISIVDHFLINHLGIFFHWMYILDAFFSLYPCTLIMILIWFWCLVSTLALNWWSYQIYRHLLIEELSDWIAFKWWNNVCSCSHIVYIHTESRNTWKSAQCVRKGTGNTEHRIQPRILFSGCST